MNWQILDTYMYLVGLLGNQFIGGLLVDDVRLHMPKGISHMPGQSVLRMDFRRSRCSRLPARIGVNSLTTQYFLRGDGFVGKTIIHIGTQQDTMYNKYVT